MKTILISKSPTLEIVFCILGNTSFLYGSLVFCFAQDEIEVVIAKTGLVIGLMLLVTSVVLFRNRPVAMILSENGLFINQFSVTIGWRFIKDAKLYFPYRDLDIGDFALMALFSNGAASKYAMLAITFTDEGVQEYGRRRFIAARHRSLMKLNHHILLPILSLNFHPFTSRVLQRPDDLIEEIQCRIHLYQSDK